MNTRILHCSTSVENYNICTDQNVAGFSHRGPQPGDLIYLAVKVGKQTFCGVRFTLDAVTDLKPWPDAEKYVHALSIKNVEFCTPFALNILSEVGGKNWSMNYVQRSKPIKDEAARELLNQSFESNKVDQFIPYNIAPPSDIADKTIVSTANEPIDVYESVVDDIPLIRDSFRIQAILAEIGARMNYQIWLPKSDRSRILEIWGEDQFPILKDLPLNYDYDTLSTIENIDVLWIKGHSIIRAFEVEHTTSIYSGILRMADLMSLQPNLRIKAHIVAPMERKGKVMQELSRPVFRYVLAHTCTFLSYTSIEELALDKRLKFMSDNILEAYAESAEAV
ncbi:hypothetical protein ACXYMU_19450 [Pontibacter sp. CAU 1760]